MMGKNPCHKAGIGRMKNLKYLYAGYLQSLYNEGKNGYLKKEIKTNQTENFATKNCNP